MVAYLQTLGCKVNQYETQLMREALENDGCTIIDDASKADIIVINSCAVTAESERKTRQTVRHQRRANPDAIIVLTGCMTQAFPESGSKLSEADIVLGNANNFELIPALHKYLETHNKSCSVIPHESEYIKSTVTGFPNRTKAFIKIEDGCNQFCTYCIIPYSRGRIRSKPIELLRSEVESLAAHGHKEVVLIGINLSAYGREFGLDLADAVKCAADVSGIERVRLGSMEPDHFTDDLICKLSRISKLCPQFHLSLQSGCDKTLKAMNRHYDTQFYRELVANLRKHFENCSVTTDIMVGFAGETDENFSKSVEFACEIGFAKANIFAYSRRPGTVADKLPDQVTNAVKHERSCEMIAKTFEKQQEFLRSQLGKTFDVLYENRSEGEFYEGYTPNYSPVKCRFESDPCGKIIPTYLSDIDGEYCIGEALRK